MWIWYETANGNNYIKSDLIGDIFGTFGNTYICHKNKNKNKNNETYAVKQISKAKFYKIELNKRIELIETIKNEMEVITVLKHNNIITL